MSAEAAKHATGEAAETSAETAAESASEAHTAESAEVAEVQKDTRSSFEKFRGIFSSSPEEKALKAEQKAHAKAEKAAKKVTLAAERKTLRQKITSGAWKVIKGLAWGVTSPVWWPTKQAINLGIWGVNVVKAIPHTTLFKGTVKYPLSASSYKLGKGGGHGGGGH